ncbi:MULTISPECIES: glycosyltransferase family 2 protein [Pectobacterium]|uniref:glycosyltransferase family 2 protein n=1 Tax=Pectobacterium TaxID=122277 RepID=UPI000DCFA392|nr:MULTISPECIES: glycosyltransferase [Pectobacterium]MCA5932537.1 glycosyltransferase [Pectobacterium versatile]MCA5949869.1 glycosyltransferase [Pectobacterium versatile]MCA5954140.1 glycosyltransferase [Pectobacterium versatile]MCU1800320.1 glycosyltransferase [Pectobacterium parvum]UCP85215.1 glycosyltransferase [Pectobacterium versatile]
MSTLKSEHTLLSIIIPVYNVEKYIKSCLNSLVSKIKIEHFSKIEIIIVNDGSQDASRDIIIPFVNQYPFLMFFEKSNGGLSDARNYGLERSSGDFISFIDSDDCVHNEFVNIVLDVINNNFFDIFSFEYAKFHNDEDLVYLSPFNTANVVGVDKEFYFKQPVFAWNKIYNKKLFSDLRFTKDLYFEDVALIPIVVDISKVFLHCNIPLYSYRQRSGAITSFQDDKYLDILEGTSILWSKSRSSYIKTVIMNQFFTLMLLSLRLPLKKSHSNMVHITSYYKRNFDLSLFDFTFKPKHIPFNLLRFLGGRMLGVIFILKPFVLFHFKLKNKNIWF